METYDKMPTLSNLGFDRDGVTALLPNQAIEKIAVMDTNNVMLKSQYKVTIIVTKEDPSNSVSSNLFLTPGAYLKS